jgi:hypothetical protein
VGVGVSVEAAVVAGVVSGDLGVVVVVGSVDSDVVVLIDEGGEEGLGSSVVAGVNGALFVGEVVGVGLTRLLTDLCKNATPLWAAEGLGQDSAISCNAI